MAGEIVKIKVSDPSIPEAQSLAGFKALGINAQNQSVKVDLGLIRAGVDQIIADTGAAADEALDAKEQVLTTEEAIALAETARQQAETTRGNNETTRQQNETARGTAETARSNAETGRTTAEQGRVTAETSRANNETARGTAETGRSNAETARATAETGRGTAEAGRATAETARVAAEQNRETIMQGYDNRLLTAENKISRLYPYGQIFYGVERVRGSADPVFTTVIGNADQHTNLPLHRMIRACKAGEDRKIRNYLNQTNWNYNEDGTPSVLDGSDGLDVMLYYPHLWAILDGGGSDGTKERWIISDGPFTYDGDVAIEIKSYLDSPDFCTLQSGVNKLRSVRNETATFAGSGSLATSGGLGYPRTVISRYNNEVYAGNKGAEWKAWYYRDHLVLAAFMYIEYKTKNLKSVFGNMGHNWSSANWTAYNNIYPVRKIFETHLALSGTAAIISKGHLTGTWTKHFEFLNAGTPVVYDTPFGVYRGKIMWGDMWKWMCGIEHEVQSDAAGGVSNIWIQFNPALIDANRSDSSFLFKDTYTLVGTAPRVNGWSKSTNPKSKQSREVGGGETTYDCMYFYTSPPSSGTARHGVIVGASLNPGSSCAFGISNTYNAPTYASSSLGVGCRADVDE